MKKKNIIFALIICALSFTLSACEKSTQIKAASIREITTSGSDIYGVSISYADDDRLEGKGTDIQIKFNNIGTIKIGKEHQDKFDYKINDYDEWYSMTAILAEKDGKQGQEKFEKYEDALTKTYLFQYDGDIKITFRVVIGEIEENSAGTGEILAGSEPISDNFTLKIK